MYLFAYHFQPCEAKLGLIPSLVTVLYTDFYSLAKLSFLILTYLEISFIPYPIHTETWNFVSLNIWQVSKWSIKKIPNPNSFRARTFWKFFFFNKTKIQKLCIIKISLFFFFFALRWQNNTQNHKITIKALNNIFDYDYLLGSFWTQTCIWENI